MGNGNSESGNHFNHPTTKYLLYERKRCPHRQSDSSKHANLCANTVPDVDCSLDEVLEAGWTAPTGAQALLQGEHEIFQVLREVLVLIAKKINL